MSGTFGTNGKGLRGLPGGVREAVEQFFSGVDKRVSMRMGRGDVRTAVLLLLAEAPMHGYQIIHEIEDRSGGAWKPSPGSVYPTLQLLTDEGYLQSEESNGRKTYSLTAAGLAEVEVVSEEGAAPWDAPTLRDSGRATALPKAGMELAQVAAHVGRTGTPEQVRQAVDTLDEARRKLYSILAAQD
ncbi:PadR family transcriptional regulator [Microbacterium sp. X-17]|uniref:PadR family transcriptional regulator n=1 Tax=Microbacterium sp. X-17 TaxID=3144404 RepID=UPI0031F52CAD